MYTVLFVCTGNTCRSSMAQALAKGTVDKKGMGKRVKIISAGTSIIPGSKANQNSITVMKERGLNLKKHTAKQLTAEMIEQADLVLTMTRDHQQYALALAPKAQDKIFTLKEYINNLVSHEEVEDLLVELGGRLEAKQIQFYEENNREIDELKEQQKKLKEQLQQIEAKLQDWYIRLYEYTKDERQAVKEVESHLLDIDVLDPIGQSVEVYRECADELEESIDIILKKIIIPEKEVSHTMNSNPVLRRIMNSDKK